ncbi:hypothetical protein [uncultured Treponema sp.]|uniref:hypothetical protein n=1 Tax=uncultured Treponema sp. TaxID=162155 RepID=UPI002594E58F|nr:hypothetical protein [uncultured Treponema sp.]
MPDFRIIPGSYKDFKGINRFSEFLRPHFSRLSFIFNIFPSVRLNWTSHPKKLYWRYTRLIEKLLTPEEKEIIIRENLRDDETSGHRGPEWDCYAEVFWSLIQEENM